MKDNVPKGTGNSRYLKSAISSSTTWEQFRTMLMNGTLPIDLNGVNAAGWQVLGDALNKANLLPDSLESALGLTGNPQIKDALSALKALAEKHHFVAGTYVGTGTYGENAPCKLTFNFKPVLVIVNGTGATNPWARRIEYGPTTASGNYNVVLTWGNTFISWYRATNAPDQMNASGFTYNYIAIGI